MSASAATVASAVGGRLVDGGAPKTQIRDVTHDSRFVETGFLFCCVSGESTDGHDFAANAVENGATALLVDRELPFETTQILVDDVRLAMGLAAAQVHGHPSQELTVVGVTGTNGKSSIIQILQDLLSSAGRPTELVGTLQGPRTTPESTDLQRMLRSFVDSGTDTVAMEVSSHALVLHRVIGIRFDCSIFTNLGRDHLDFHHDMESYFEAKASLFTAAYSDAGVINSDDPYGRELLARVEIPAFPYSLAEAEDIRYEGPITLFRWRGRDITLHLAGAHNVSNALGAANAATVLGLTEDQVAEGLCRTYPVRGRFELVDRGQPFIVAVDYAHTPDALDSALLAARQAANNNRIVLVFGCGGDRDVQKRPEMGQVAEKGADVVIVTSDNPRSEPPQKIISDILAGVERANEIEVEPDRRAAIGKAVSMAEPGDVVLIAGKGHETYQVIGNETVDFDDLAVAGELLGGAR